MCYVVAKELTHLHWLICWVDMAYYVGAGCGLEFPVGNANAVMKAKRVLLVCGGFFVVAVNTIQKASL